MRLGARAAPGGGVDLAESTRAAADGRAPRLPGPLLLYAASCGRAGELLAAAPEPLRASMEGDARALEGADLARAALSGERPDGLSRGCWKHLASWASAVCEGERRAADRDADLERARRAVRLGAAGEGEVARRLGWGEGRLAAVLAGEAPCSREEAASVRRAAFEAAREARCGRYEG